MGRADHKWIKSGRIGDADLRARATRAQPNEGPQGLVVDVRPDRKDLARTPRADPAICPGRRRGDTQRYSCRSDGLPLLVTISREGSVSTETRRAAVTALTGLVALALPGAIASSDLADAALVDLGALVECDAQETGCPEDDLGLVRQ